MLDNNQIAAASKTLHDHWRAGTKFDALDDALRPRERAEGYAIQAAIENYSTGKLFGWKIAATSEAGQKHINVEGPMAGRILPETIIPDGGTASMAGNEMRVGEPEFAFRMARDLPPRPSPYTVQEVLDAVGTLHPAIEIPDSRFQNFVNAGAAQIIADNGPGIPVDQRDQVFKRFYRLEQSRYTPGNGLGLSLVSAVARLHGARIEMFDNSPGLQFKLWFSALDTQRQYHASERAGGTLELRDRPQNTFIRPQ